MTALDQQQLMNYKVQIEVNENDLILSVPQHGDTEFIEGSQMLIKPNNLTPEQQEHLGSLFFLLSNGTINSEMQECLNQANLEVVSESWLKHEHEKDVNGFLNEDVLSPHEVLSSNPNYRSYSGPLDKPEKIRLDYNEIDLKNKAIFDSHDGEESGQFFGFEKIYELNVNFRLTKDVVNLFIPINGVEVAQPISRYKMLIGFGKLFDEEEIKFEIHKAIDEYFESL